MIDRSKSAEPADVLLVEPSETLARRARDGLSGGHSTTTVHSVSDGDTALDFLHQRGEYADAPHPCLVILRFDLPGPGPDGAGVLEALSHKTDLTRIPIVVLVDSPIEETVHDAYQLGANAVIPTSTDPDAVVETMKQAAQFWIATARLPNRIDRI